MYLKEWNTDSLKLSYSNILKISVTKIVKIKGTKYYQQLREGQLDDVIMISSKNGTKFWNRKLKTKPHILEKMFKLYSNVWLLWRNLKENRFDTWQLLHWCRVSCDFQCGCWQGRKN